jgi:hypothetical protein
MSRPILMGLLLAAASGMTAKADFILTNYGTGTATGSWAYSKAAGVGGDSSTFIPLRSYWSNESFQGYVNFDGNGKIDTVGSGIHDEDTVYIFRAFVTAATNTSVTILTGDDDGHAT